MPRLRGLSSASAVKDAVAVLGREDVLLAAPPVFGKGRPVLIARWYIGSKLSSFR